MRTQEFVQTLVKLAREASFSNEAAVCRSAGVLLVLAGSIMAGEEYHNEMVEMAKNLTDKHLTVLRPTNSTTNTAN